MNIKKIKNIDVILVEYRWILTFNLTDLIKNLEGMILGLFVTKWCGCGFKLLVEIWKETGVWPQQIHGFVSTILAVLSCLVETRAWDHLISNIVWQAMKKA